MRPARFLWPQLPPVHQYLYYMGGSAILQPSLQPARTYLLTLYGPKVLARRDKTPHRRWTAGRPYKSNL